MSLALAKAGHLKPDIRLAQAVSEFEAELTSEEKAIFRNNKATASKSPPSTEDVMRLTAEIARSEKGGHILGPRAMNIVLAVQQFASLGDIIIGGSQNLIACGAWTVVRMSLLTLVKSSSHLEKISTLLLHVGRSAPRFDSLAALYPRSSSLQSSLFEYFAIVVRLCHYMIKFTRKSSLGKLGSSLNSSTLDNYESLLDTWAKEIEKEVGYLVALRVETEATANSHFRSFFKRSKNQEIVHSKQRVLKFCSSYDHRASWRQIRKAGNTMAFREVDEYRDWKKHGSIRTIAWVAKVGAGKSVLLANLIDDLLLDSKESTPIAFFFARHDVAESLRAIAIIGSLARQILSQGHDLAAASNSLIQENEVHSIENIIKLLLSTLNPQYRAFIVIDGMDEIERHEQKLLFEQLKALQDNFEISICFSFRSNPYDSLKADFYHLASASVCAMPDNTPEIEQFIRERLEELVKSKELVVGDPDLITEIKEALVNGSKGMFLWVALQIAELCNMQTDHAIREALQDLPKDLPGTFSRILNRSGASSDYQKKLLQLVSVAQRPLLAGELVEALSVVPGDTNWEPSMRINDIKSTLLCCGSLVIIDEDELTVRFVHHSVKQYLTGPFHDTAPQIQIEDANTVMSQILLTYLNCPQFETRVSMHNHVEAKAKPAMDSILKSTQDSLGRKGGQVLELLRNRPFKPTDLDISKSFVRQPKSSTLESQIGIFKAYASHFWGVHVSFSGYLPELYNTLASRIGEKDISMCPDVESCVAMIKWIAKTDNLTFGKLYLKLNTSNSYYATSSNAFAILDILLHQNSAKVFKIFAESHRFGEPLPRFAIDTLVESLNLGDCTMEMFHNLLYCLSPEGSLYHTAGVITLLQKASNNDHYVVARFLLEQLDQHNSYYTESIWLTILKTIQDGNLKYTELILNSPATPKLDPKEEDSLRPLTQTIQVTQNNAIHRLQAIKLFKASGKLNLNSLSNRFSAEAQLNPLQTLATLTDARNQEVCQILLSDCELDQQVQIDALCTAVKSDNIPIIGALLSLKNQWLNDSVLSEGLTLFQFAAKYGNTMVVEFLLDSGYAWLDLTDENGQTALWQAAHSNREPVAKLHAIITCHYLPIQSVTTHTAGRAGP